MTRPAFHIRLICLVVLSFGTRSACAQWNTDPNVRNAVSIADSTQRNPAMCSDGEGGALIAWENEVGDSVHYYIYVQRMSDRGNPLWRGNGLPLTHCLESPAHKPKLCSDGAAGAIVAFYEDTCLCGHQLFVQRMDSTGNIMWGCAGIRISGTQNVSELSRVIADGMGGAYVVWGVYDYFAAPLEKWSMNVTRIDSAGTVMWTKLATPAPLRGWMHGLTAASDSLGNLFIGWFFHAGMEASPDTLHLQKLTLAGGMGWGANGISLPSVSSDGVALAGSQTGGVFVMSTNLATENLAQLSIVSSTGIVQSTTNLNIGSLYSLYPSVACDGRDGAVCGCVAELSVEGAPNAKLALQRVDKTGTLRFGANSVIVADPEGKMVGLIALVSDGMGGAIAAWEQNPVQNCYATHVDSTGNLFWGATGKPVCTAPKEQFAIAGVSDFPDQILCSWQDYRDTGTRVDIYAAKLGDPWLVTTDSIVDFGKVNVGDTMTITKAGLLQNIGVEDVLVSSDVLNGAVPELYDFTLLNDTTNLTLPYRTSRDLKVSFAPTKAAAENSYLNYTSNTRFTSPVVHLRGRGVNPAIACNPLSINFGIRGIGSLHDSTLVQVIRSTGSGFLHIDSMRIAGSSGAFVLDSGNVAPVILDSGKTLTVRVGFRPVAKGAVQDTLLIYNNSAVTGSVRLLGNGVKGALVFDNSALDFGDVIVLQHVDSITNPRNPNSTLDTVKSLALSGGDTSQFSIQNLSLPIAFAPGSRQSIKVRFAPTSAGLKSSTLVAVDVNGETVATYPVRGNGIVEQQKHKPILQFTAATVDMGDTLVGSLVGQTLTGWITNTGDTTLAISNMSVFTADPAEFTVEDSMIPYIVAVGASHTITVHFMPKSVGTKSATVEFFGNVAPVPQLTLNGKAHALSNTPAIALKAQVIDCGSSRVFVQRVVTIAGFIHNPGTGTLAISGMTIGGLNNTDYQLTSPSTVSISAGDSAALTIRFTPSAVGPRGALLVIHSNVPDTSVGLMGTGTMGQLTLTAQSIDFGKVPVGEFKEDTLASFITNTGTDTATIIQTPTTGTAASAFAWMLPNRPLVLAPDATATLQLKFTPAHTGVHSANLLIITPADTTTVSLTGRGVRQLRLSALNAEGKPGTTVLVPIKSDSTFAGTSITGLDIQLQFTPSQFYPVRVATVGTGTSGWTFDAPVMMGNSVVLHGTGPKVSPGVYLLDLEGTILQGSVLQAPITIIASTPAGDSDVTFAALSGGTITVDTLCGYGSQAFKSTSASLFVWPPQPNPSSSIVHIPFRLGTASAVSMTVSDEQGRRVASQMLPSQTAGDYQFHFDTQSLSPGVYLFSIRCAESEMTRRFVVSH